MKQPIPFGKYYLLERVNVGGMAEVFKAKATGVEGFERLVAVKRILPSIAEDEEFITMFIDEAKIAVQLTHASIAQIFDLGKVDDSFFIALEYVHGKDLRAIFNRARARGEQIPIPMACYCTMKVCEGLDYAHNKRDSAGGSLNLVHRDVSPQNLLVSYEGEVKIIDFGIAKAAGKAGKTQAGILKGKFGYMSPEQVQGMEIDRRSDIFGLGICLYELLTGERLFVAESDFATLEKVKNVDIMPPSTYNRRIPEELEQIVLKALARDRERRHQTAMALHDELQSFMYSSGNFFGRKDLSMYMHRAFAEEIDRESARDQEYASIPAPPMDHDTGLAAFEEIDPVSAVSALNVEPLSAPIPMRAPHPRATPTPALRHPSSPGLPRKSTLLGMPPAGGGAIRSGLPPRPSVPPMIPRPQSIPPGASSRPPAPPPGLDMDWDDEELSTQIYDRPEDATPAPTSPVSPFTPPPSYAAPMQGIPPQATPSQPVAMSPAPTPLPANYTPPAGLPPTPGIPSPFGPGGMPPPETREVALEAAEWSSGNRRSMAWAGVGVVAIVCAIVVGLVLFRPPAFGTLHISTVPRDSQLMVDGKAVSGSSPFVVSEMEPAVTHEIQVSKTGFRTWTGKVEVQPDQTLQLPDVELDALESGFALDSVPSGATVFVDGRKLDRTTPVRVTDLSAGDHQIRLESEGYGPWESSLHVTTGNVLDLPNAQLTPTTPEPSAEAAQPEPRHTAPPERPRKRTVYRPPPTPKVSPPIEEVEPEPEPAEPEPEPAATGGTGTLRVQTRPWSKVFVDGRLIGNTPQMGISLSSGRHTVTFVNDDFGIRKTIRVDIKSGDVLTKVLNLAE